MACISTLSFTDIRNSTIRITEDGLGDVLDTVMAVTGKDCNHANEILRDIDPSLFDTSSFVMISKRRYATLEALIELIMVLPGKKAKHARKRFKDVITRYLDGDTSMCSEIEVNQSMGKIKSYSKFASKVMNSIHGEKVKKSRQMPPISYVYATKSPAFPGLIKIGKTIDVDSRVTQLNISCAPAPHVVVAVAPYFDHNRDETTAHTFFARARREGEFFALSDLEVINYFSTHITSHFNVELAQNIARIQAMGN